MGLPKSLSQSTVSDPDTHGSYPCPLYLRPLFRAELITQHGMNPLGALLPHLTDHQMRKGCLQNTELGTHVRREHVNQIPTLVWPAGHVSLAPPAGLSRQPDPRIWTLVKSYTCRPHCLNKLAFRPGVVVRPYLRPWTSIDKVPNHRSSKSSA